jgi:hypothetical protein
LCIVLANYEIGNQQSVLIYVKEPSEMRPTDPNAQQAADSITASKLAKTKTSLAVIAFSTSTALVFAIPRTGS